MAKKALLIGINRYRIPGSDLRGCVNDIDNMARTLTAFAGFGAADIAAEVLISGCRDTQTSADAYIGKSYNGALTYHLVAAIKAAKGKLSYRELHEHTREKLQAGGYDQVPQLEGRAERLEGQFLGAVA